MNSTHYSAVTSSDLRVLLRNDGERIAPGFQVESEKKKRTFKLCHSPWTMIVKWHSHSEWHSNRYFELLAVSEQDKKGLQVNFSPCIRRAPFGVCKQLKQ